MAILVAADFSADEWSVWWPLLQQALPGEQLVRDLGDPVLASGRSAVTAALVANPPPGSLADLPNLGLIQSLWAGVDRLLEDASVPTHVPLARMVDPAMTEAMAQTALWAVLGLHRDADRYARQQRTSQWCQHPPRKAEEVTVAVLGLGEMGRSTARRLRASGYRVLGWSRSAAALDDVPVDSGPAGLRRVLSAAQIVINLLPLTPDTRRLLGVQALAQMPRGACLVNLGRGDHVDEAALCDALDRGHLRHAVLDVFATEPLPAAHPLWAHPGVTVLPHVAAQTDPRSAAPIAARNVQDWRAGRPVRNLVDRTRGY